MAGAQGELTSVLMVKKFFEDAGDDARTTVLVPSTAHGTNPATASMAGFESKEIGLDEHGCVDVDELRSMVGRDHGGAHDHQPEHLRRLRAEHRRDSRGPARSGRLPVHGRREHERQHGPDASRRGRCGHHALQPAQDLLHPSRRRRSRLRRHRLHGRARAVPSRPGSGTSAKTTRSSGPRRASGA